MQSLAEIEQTLPWLRGLYSNGQSFEEVLTRPEGFNGPSEGVVSTVQVKPGYLIESGWSLFRAWNADFVLFADQKGKALRVITRQMINNQEPEKTRSCLQARSEHESRPDWADHAAWIIVETGVWSAPYQLRIHQIVWTE